MNLPKFACNGLYCIRLLSTMPKVKLVDSKCITKGVLSVLFIAVFANNLEDCFGKKEIVSDLVTHSASYHGIIFLPSRNLFWRRG